MQKLNCLRCNIPMEYVTRESFQKGECGAWVGNLNFSFRGGYEMEVYRCPKCGKLEFFEPDWEDKLEDKDQFPDGFSMLEAGEITRVNRDGIPQVRGRCCGQEHDFGYPACPHCGYACNK